MSALTSSVRLLVGMLAVAVVSFSASPWVLYGVGLHAAGGRPEPPRRIAPEGAQLAYWQKERGVGEPRLTPRNPFTYRTALADPGPERPGLKAAFSIASRHLRENARYQGRFWWHLSSSALTIWLTRNWSIEEILSGAIEIEDRQGSRRDEADATLQRRATTTHLHRPGIARRTMSTANDAEVESGRRGPVREIARTR